MTGIELLILGMVGGMALVVVLIWILESWGNMRLKRAIKRDNIERFMKNLEETFKCPKCGNIMLPSTDITEEHYWSTCPHCRKQQLKFGAGLVEDSPRRKYTL